MHSDALKVFVTICRQGGFVAAADHLNRSQPAVSRRIALLEEEVGAPLFDRAAGGGRLTPVGAALLPRAERVLAALEDCTAAMREMVGGPAGRVGLVAVGTLAGHPLAPALKRFAAGAPGVTLDIATATSDEVTARVRSGAAEIGLRYGLRAEPDLEVTSLGREPMAVAAPPGRDGARGLADLADETWLIFPAIAGAPSPANILTHFAAAGIGGVSWRPVDSLTAQKRLVEAGFGLALMPASAMQEELSRGSLVALPVADLKAGNPVALLTRRGGYLTPAALALAETLRGVDWGGAGG